MDDYQQFLDRKTQLGADSGFDPVWMPDFLFPFQRSLVEWSLRRGRSALFADCGLGKTPMQLVWAENVHRKTGKPVLILTPLAVSFQTKCEAEKFGIDADVSRDGSIIAPIVITNCERLHYFDSEQFGGVVCDESSILKNFDGATRGAVTDFMRKTPYRLLCTATAAPNDYIELGTHSEAIGELERKHMLARFFTHDSEDTSQWRLKGHARTHEFWRWVCSWARAVRKPSDMGFDNNGFVLPNLSTVEHVVQAVTRREGFLFDMPAVGLQEQREERRRTLNERCEMAAALVANTGKPAVAWCHLNAEGNLLERLIPGAVEVDGADPDEKKEEAFTGFAKGQIRVLVSKPVIAGFGMNWQHCAHQTFFPSHSFEQFYQAVRRSWRFGQKNTVRVDVIASEGEKGVLANLNRKAQQADAMFASLVKMMNDELRIARRNNNATKKEQAPSWL